MKIKEKYLKTIILIFVFITLAIFGYITLGMKNIVTSSINDIVVENGKQVLKLTATSTFSPNVINAKANIPTILRVDAKNVAGCTTTLNIAKLNISQQLLGKDKVDIEIPPQTVGTNLIGLCSMGMNRFDINFN